MVSGEGRGPARWRPLPSGPAPWHHAGHGRAGSVIADRRPHCRPAADRLPYWRLPYNADYLADTPVRIGFAGLALIAALLAATGAARPGRIIRLMLIPYPLAVALRVAVEVAADPTSHNLWPFELVFAVVLSALLVVPGVVVGRVVRRVRG